MLYLPYPALGTVFLMYLLVIIIIVVAVIFWSTQEAKFGQHSSGERLARLKRSPHYREGKFHNLSETPVMTAGAGYFAVLKEYFLAENKPRRQLPSLKTDLRALDPARNLLVWFGHSSYYLQLDGKRMLIDPVFSKAAAPVPFVNRAFRGTSLYRAADLPDIDYLFISHDHWDHLDYSTIKRLRSKVRLAILPLGVGAHFERWNFSEKTLLEMDWQETAEPDPGFAITAVPARHFSGRAFRNNRSLWASFVLRTPSFNIFLGGDSGYDTHFADIGGRFGLFDLAILENGQYHDNWRYIHMKPEEVIDAARDLRAKRILPVHSGRFALSSHSWDEPLRTLMEFNKDAKLDIMTPRIGEVVDLDNSAQAFTQWWNMAE